MTWPETPPTQPPSQPPSQPPTSPVAPTMESSRTTTPGSNASRPPRRARTILGIVMLFVVGLSATFGVASFWTANAILDQDTWVATSKAIVDNPDVQQDVAQALSTQIVDIVGVDAFIAGVLPGPLSGFSGSVTQRVVDLLALATVQVVKTEAFVNVWEAAIRATHDEFVYAVNGNNRYLSVDSQGLSLDLGASLEEINKQLNDRGITVLNNVDLQSIDLKILLVDAPGLERIRTWVRVLRVGAIVFPAIAVIGAVAGLVVARRRALAVMSGAIGALVGAGIIAFLASSGRERAVENIAGGLLGVSSARVIVNEILSGLGTALLVTCVVAGVVLLASIAVAVVMVSRSRELVVEADSSST